MGLISKNKSAGGLVQRFLGSAYDVVKKVHDSLPFLQGIFDKLTFLEGTAQTVQQFLNLYYGALAVAPVLRPDGDPIVVGDMYYDTVKNSLMVYEQGVWESHSRATRYMQRVVITAAHHNGVDTVIALDNEYIPDTNALTVIAGGVFQYSKSLHLETGSYTEANATTVVFNDHLIPIGTTVVIAQIETTLGTKGDKGEKGDKGDTGDVGPTGLKGDPGTAGVDGTVQFDYLRPDQIAQLKGDKGDQGLKGDKGDPGTDGVDGAPGGAFADLTLEEKASLKGDKGDKGDIGVTGATGPAGADSTVPGPKGDPGINGTNGTNGAAGSDGLSAYQVWINAGNSGSEAVYLASLVGADGAAGTNGTNGAKGDKGDPGTNGTNGAKGDKGDQGIQGPAGADHSSDGTVRYQGVIKLYAEDNGVTIDGRCTMNDIAITSDERLKSDLVKISPKKASELFEGIDAYYYTIGGTENQIGYMAQHFIEAGYPELVIKNERTNYYALNYRAIAVLLSVARKHDLERLARIEKHLGL